MGERGCAPLSLASAAPLPLSLSVHNRSPRTPGCTHGCATMQIECGECMQRVRLTAAVLLAHSRRAGALHCCRSSPVQMSARCRPLLCHDAVNPVIKTILLLVAAIGTPSVFVDPKLVVLGCVLLALAVYAVWNQWHTGRRNRGAQIQSPPVEPQLATMHAAPASPP